MLVPAFVVAAYFSHFTTVQCWYPIVVSAYFSHFTRSTRPVSPVRCAPSVAQHTEQQPATGYDSEGDEDDDEDEDALDQHSVMTLDGEIHPAPAAVQRYRQAHIENNSIENASDLSLGVDASGEDGVAVRRRTRLIEPAPSSPGLCAPAPVSLRSRPCVSHCNVARRSSRCKCDALAQQRLVSTRSDMLAWECLQ